MRKILLFLVIAASAITSRAQDSICATVNEPGTLSQYLPKDTSDMYDVKSLKIIGSINSTDIGYIRAMGGNASDGYKTDGRLRTLDLSEAKIVRGGNAYWTDPADAYETSSILRDNTIGYDMFRECASLRYVTLPEGITEIKDGAFTSCTDLRKVNIPSTVKKIGEGFRNCHKLTSITLPEGITEIGDFCFSHCTGLTEIDIPVAVKTIGDGAFCYSGIKKVIVPEGVKNIGVAAFSDCENLTTVILPSTTTKIGDNAFLRDSALTSIYCFAETPPSVGQDAFTMTSKKNSDKPILHVPADTKAFYNQKNGVSENLTVEEMPDGTTYSQVVEMINTTTGISSVKRTYVSTKDAPRYNLSGQRVSSSYKGIVIQNGRKFVAK